MMFSITSLAPSRLVGGPARALATAALVLGTVVVVSPLTANAGGKGKVISFSGHYSGATSLLINNGVATISTVHGKGSGTLVGTSTVAGSGAASASAQCDPFEVAGAITGKQAKINLTILKSTSQGCSSGQSGPVTVTISGTAKATGGTGKAAGASGVLKFTGSVNLKDTSGSQSGTFTVTFSGKLAVKG
jgi:hypothetical protein